MKIQKIDLKKWFSSIQWTKSNLLFLAGTAAALLLLLSTFTGQDQEKEQAPENQQTAREYTDELEKRLTSTLAQIDGVGKVEVMITLENDWETVYAQEEKTGAQSAEPAGGQGSRSSQDSYQNSYVMVDSANGRKALVTTNREPAVKGVAVVCEGGGDIAVVNNVTEVVRVVLGVPSNRVCVTKLN